MRLQSHGQYFMAFWVIVLNSTLNTGGHEENHRPVASQYTITAMKAAPLVTTCQLANTSQWKTHVNFIRIYIPFPFFTIVNSKLPRRGLEGLYSTSISPKTSDKSAATASALRLNTCQDLLEKKEENNDVVIFTGGRF
jgi:hypothetical protein